MRLLLADVEDDRPGAEAELLAQRGVGRRGDGRRAAEAERDDVELGRRDAEVALKLLAGGVRDRHDAVGAPGDPRDERAPQAMVERVLGMA